MPLFKKRAAKKLVEEAMLYHEQKNLLKAKETFEKALSIYEKLPEAHLLYGDVMKELNNLAEAERHYKRATEIKPELAEAHGALGELLHRQGRKQEAEKAYKKSIEVNPYYVNSYLNLATLYQDCAAFDQMKVIYKQALPYVEDPNLRKRIEEKLR